MVLKEHDFAVFTANWQPKSENIRAIAKELNLGLDSFVFVDDSPFERAEVRAALPEVLVPEIPDDPAGICAVLETLPGLELATRPSAEDARRTAMYQIERERALLERQAGSRDDFLSSLQMTGIFAPITAAELSRAAQLIQRSNQFNLRTQRLPPDQIKALSAGTHSFACFCSLKDRFGDHGIIAVLCGEIREPGVLLITEWCMSCRVLGRGVEEFIRNNLVAIARAKGAHTLRGEYLPTEKNAMVSGLYEKLGFTRTDADPAQFDLRVDTAVPLPTFVQPDTSRTDL
jgi:FkbH-like protein